MTAKHLLPQDLDVLMTTAEDDGAAEPRANPMALKSNEQFKDDIELRFVIDFLKKDAQR